MFAGPHRRRRTHLFHACMHPSGNVRLYQLRGWNGAELRATMYETKVLSQVHVHPVLELPRMHPSRGHEHVGAGGGGGTVGKVSGLSTCTYLLFRIIVS